MILNLDNNVLMQSIAINSKNCFLKYFCYCIRARLTCVAQGFYWICSSSICDKCRNGKTVFGSRCQIFYGSILKFYSNIAIIIDRGWVSLGQYHVPISFFMIHWLHPLQDYEVGGDSHHSHILHFIRLY